MRLVLLIILTIPAFGQIDQEERLWNAYAQKSKEELGLFFKNWSAEMKPVTDVYLNSLNDTLKQAYTVFEKFYQLKNNKNSEYIIVQSEIAIRFTKTLNKDSIIRDNVKELTGLDTVMQNKLLEKVNGEYKGSTMRLYFHREEGTIVDTISDFRPQIKNGVSLTEKYKRILNEFLYKSSEGIWNSNEDESKRRLSFINQIAAIRQGRVLQLDAMYLVFDTKMKYALINYRRNECGGEVLLERQSENDWKIIEARETWCN